MAKRKDYKLDYKSIVTGNLRKGNVEAARNEARRALSKKQNTEYNVGVNNYNAMRPKLLPAVITDNSEYEEKVRSAIPIQLSENKDITNKLARKKAWIDRVRIKQESAKSKQELYQDMTKMLYPQHFKKKLLASNTPNEVVDKLVNTLYELYKEQYPHIRYTMMHRNALDNMLGGYQFTKAWESKVFESLVQDYTTKRLTDEELLQYVKSLDRYKQANLYNLLYSYKAMPTGHYEGIQKLIAKVNANRKAILAGTAYEDAPKEEQSKYISAFYKTFREWAKSIDKTQYDSEDAFAAFQSINFTDIDSLNMNDVLAGELADRLSKRAQDKLEEEQILNDMFKQTSKFRLHSMNTSRASRAENKIDTIDDIIYDESISLDSRLEIGRHAGLTPIMEDILDEEGNVIDTRIVEWRAPENRGIQL